MTQERLAEIEARANAAIAGPWRRGYKGMPGYHDGVVYPDGPGIDWVGQCPEPKPLFHAQVPNSPRFRENAEFIAHARTDIPDLIAEVRHQQAEVRRLREDKQG